MKKPKKFLAFIENHDESWGFFFTYLFVSLFLSYYFNLGFFVLLLIVHVFIDFLKHWHSNNRITNHARAAFVYALRDGFLFDAVFILACLNLGFAFHIIIGAGFSRGIKLASSETVDAVLRAIPRISAADWIVEHIATVSSYIRENDKKRVYMPPRLTNYEKTLITIGVLCIALIFVLPVITQQSYDTLFSYMYHELVPFVVHPGQPISE